MRSMPPGSRSSRNATAVSSLREAFREVQARAAASAGPPPFGMHILMKTDVAQKLANVIGALEQGLIAPIELICRAR